VGGGYVGTYTALGLQKRVRGVEVTLVAPESHMTYQPFLPEAASGNIEPRHVVVPLRRVLKRTRLIIGHVTAIDHARRSATVAPIEAEPYDLDYDHIVIAPGSISRVLPIPGLADHGVGFKTVAEAIFLRNHVLSRLDLADSTEMESIRTRALTFVVVGGGYAGVEALAELEDLARDAARLYRTVSRSDMRWILVEAASSILPEIGDELASYAIERLRRRDIEIFLNTRLTSAVDGVMELSDGTSFAADTLVWTTGVKAHPLVARSGLPLDERGRLVADEFLRVKDVEGAWTAGDCAAVPDTITGGTAPATAQHALRQARQLAANITATIAGGRLRAYSYRNLGSLVSLGRYKGVALVMGLRLRGFPAWFLHRTYHVMMIPTLNRKARVLADWTVALFFRRDVVQLGSLGHPRDDFRAAAGPDEGG